LILDCGHCDLSGVNPRINQVYLKTLDYLRGELRKNVISQEKYACGNTNSTLFCMH
jgi:hypothetical protein